MSLLVFQECSAFIPRIHGIYDQFFVRAGYFWEDKTHGDYPLTVKIEVSHIVHTA